MTKWIEDLNMAIDIAKKSQEKSDIFLDPSLCDRSNSKDYFSFKIPLLYHFACVRFKTQPSLLLFPYPLSVFFCSTPHPTAFYLSSVHFF